MKDSKRVKRHQNISQTLQSQELCIVPQSQVEGITDGFDDDLCHFDVYTKPFKHNMNKNIKSSVRHRLDKRDPISNISRA